MDIEDLADEVLPSETMAAVTYDPETGEVGVQYGYALISLPREDLASLAQLLGEASERLDEVLEKGKG